MRNMALLKSGWLWRQTAVLKRWKLNWCDLWIDGSLCFYKSDRRRDLEQRISLKTACIEVRSGLECGGVTPPESNPRENLIVVHLRDGSTLGLCANSEDESLAWKLTLLETRRNPVFAYDPYDDSYQAVPLSSYHTVYITPGAGPGTHQVVVQRDPFDGVAESVALGLLAGVAAGAAMRSFLWMPFFFC
ncbi:pleckstrin homology domain-containing family B member 1 [Kryptolebias marmoratus]|uniref:Pleckstrin homology domain containing B1 n=1 Tax=Kryptolebias marmoratus TaxID=37003 RepID=A0A3Q3BEV0_KRYMA|nr:pleckstrin homology domain-containing family B member 1 [Kryptolebias marmoratus]